MCGSQEENGGRTADKTRKRRKKKETACSCACPGACPGGEREGRLARAATNRVATGPSRQSPLQETQIKADLSSRDLFRAPPTGSPDPEAILPPPPTVPRSVGRDDKEPEVEAGAPLLSYATRIQIYWPGNAPLELFKQPTRGSGGGGSAPPPPTRPGSRRNLSPC